MRAERYTHAVASMMRLLFDHTWVAASLTPTLSRREREKYNRREAVSLVRIARIERADHPHVDAYSENGTEPDGVGASHP